jgi:uncharacterized membrane protein
MSFSPILLFHICAGTSGLLSGAVAISFRKGSRRHRVAGNVFVISMLSLSSSGTFLASMKSQMNNVFGGVLTFYLVATAWVTARRRDGETGIFDWVALLVALALAAVIVTYGLEAANSQTGLKDGIPAGMYFFLGSVALLSAAGDVRMLLRGGVFGAQRIARIFGACAMRCLSLQDLYFSDSNKYSPLSYAEPTYFSSPLSYH